MQIKRKLYTRGSSYETTIPMPLLFSTDLKQKQEVVFEYDQKTKRWYIEITQAEQTSKNKTINEKTTIKQKTSYKN